MEVGRVDSGDVLLGKGVVTGVLSEVCGVPTVDLVVSVLAESICGSWFNITFLSCLRLDYDYPVVNDRE